MLLFNSQALLSQWKPRDAAVNLDTYRNLQRHRAVLRAIARLLSWHARWNAVMWKGVRRMQNYRWHRGVRRRWTVVGCPCIAGYKNATHGWIPRRAWHIEQTVTRLTHWPRRLIMLMLITMLLLLLPMLTGLYHRRRRRLDDAEETDAGVLQQRREHHDEAGDEKDVDAFEVGDLGQRGVWAGQDGGHGEYGRDAERDASRRRVTMQPEWDPWQNNDETRRNVDMNHVVAETANKVEFARQPRVIAYNCSQFNSHHTVLRVFQLFADMNIFIPEHCDTRPAFKPDSAHRRKLRLKLSTVHKLRVFFKFKIIAQ